MVEGSPSIEVFCSYAHEDEVWLHKIIHHLRLVEHESFLLIWHDRLLKGGMDWAQEIDDRLNRSSLILLFISPDFVASDYCYGIEMRRALERHEANEARVIPILVRPVGNWQIAPFARLQALPPGKFVVEWNEREEDIPLAQIANGIYDTLEDMPTHPFSKPHENQPVIWSIPYPRNPFFIGRDEALVKLHIQLQTSQATALSQSPHALSGLGGIGKTQIAIEYAYRYHQDYEVVLWARGENRDALISSYSTLATLLNLTEREAEEQKIIVEAVKVWLQTHQKWLLILDNADDLDLLSPFLPPVVRGHIVITTRAWDMQRLATRLEVEALSEEQGAMLLLYRAGLLASETSLADVSPQDRKVATWLTHELGGLPLALDQAGAYLEAVGMSLQEYQKLYQTHRQRLLQERRSRIPDHPDAVATTWSLSFQRVEEKDSAAADLLRLCAYFAPDAIAEEILTTDGSVLAPLASDTFRRNQAIEVLRTYSLIQRNPKDRTLSVHRLVQAVLQDELKEKERHMWAERAMLAINGAFPHAEYTTWAQCECLLLYQRAVRIREQSLGPEHLDVASTLIGLANLYFKQMKYTEAEPLYQRAVCIRGLSLGPEHPDVAYPLNGLSELYREQGKYAEAEPLYQRALRIREQRLGPEHSFTRHVRKNYAILLRTIGRDEEAKKLEEKS